MRGMLKLMHRLSIRWINLYSNSILFIIRIQFHHIVLLIISRWILDVPDELTKRHEFKVHVRTSNNTYISAFVRFRFSFIHSIDKLVCVASLNEQWCKMWIRLPVSIFWISRRKILRFFLVQSTTNTANVKHRTTLFLEITGSPETNCLCDIWFCKQHPEATK